MATSSAEGDTDLEIIRVEWSQHLFLQDWGSFFKCKITISSPISCYNRIKPGLGLSSTHNKQCLLELQKEKTNKLHLTSELSGSQSMSTPSRELKSQGIIPEHTYMHKHTHTHTWLCFYREFFPDRNDIKQMVTMALTVMVRQIKSTSKPEVFNWKENYSFLTSTCGCFLISAWPDRSFTSESFSPLYCI